MAIWGKGNSPWFWSNSPWFWSNSPWFWSFFQKFPGQIPLKNQAFCDTSFGGSGTWETSTATWSWSHHPFETWDKSFQSLYFFEGGSLNVSFEGWTTPQKIRKQRNLTESDTDFSDLFLHAEILECMHPIWASSPVQSVRQWSHARHPVATKIHLNVIWGCTPWNKQLAPEKWWLEY